MTAEKGLLSSANPRVKAARSLARDASARAEEGRFLVEGPTLAREALAAGLDLREGFHSSALAEDPLVRDLRRGGVRLFTLGDRDLERISGSAQGIVLVAALPRPKPEELFASNGDLMVCVSVQDPGNAGALLRIAEAAGMAGLLADRSTADFFSPKAVRGSAGSALRLPAHRVDSLPEVLRQLSRAGVTLLAAVPRSGKELATVPIGARAALLLGGEGGGLPPEITDLGHHRVSIPMAPGVESLNVAAAAAVLAFGLRARRAAR